MSRILSRPALIQQEVEDILNWAELLEVAVWCLDSDLEERLRALPRRLKTLIVGQDSPVLFDLCAEARVSRSQQASWNGDLLVGRKQGQLRAVLGHWGHQQVQPVMCMQGTESPAELEELEDLLDAHRTHSRLAAGSALSGTARTMASPLEPMGLESLTMLSSQEGCQQAMQRLQGELQRASLNHKSCLIGENRVEVWAARGQNLYWSIQARGQALWTLHLASQPPPNGNWHPGCSPSVDSHSKKGLRFAYEGPRTFLVYLERPESLARLKGMTITTVRQTDGSVVGAAAVLAELGRTDLVRRLAEFTQQQDPAPVPARVVPAPVVRPRTEAQSDLILDQDLDDFDLEAALNGLPEHAVVQLGPITLRIKEPVTISKPLTLRGAGMNQTRIVCETSAVEGILNFDGEGPWVLSGITVERVKAEELEDDSARDCVVVAGRIDVTGCRFLGAPGAGLFCSDQSQGVVTQCEAQGNWVGIFVSTDAPMNLKDNACSSNRWAGISFHGLSSCEAHGNRCEDNQGYGIRVSGEAAPTLVNNHCLRNDEGGIFYSESAAGTAKGNECAENDGNGIWVCDQASPTLESNLCKQNTGDGIIYYDSTGGTARGNECSKNDGYGIWLANDASPTLVGNICRHNIGDGIMFYDSAGGTASGNQCSENDGSGIQVGGQSAPTLVNNRCLRNKVSGIVYSEGASGIARGNECSENDLSGILVGGEATPSLEDNHCLRNKEVGICYGESTGGSAKGNQCSENEIFGIQVGGQAAPILEDNQCSRNKGAGICYCDNAGGSASGTECSENDGLGIQVGDHASPTLEENHCVRNKESGIAYFDSTEGISKGNQCFENDGYGIHVGDQAAPTLENNHCLRNKHSGIAYSDSAAGTAGGNECSDNDEHGIQVDDQAAPTLENNHCLRNKEDGRFTDLCGRTLCIRPVTGAGISVWIMEDGRSAPTGPCLKDGQAKLFTEYLNAAWDNRADAWNSPQIYDTDSLVHVYTDKRGSVMLMTRDKVHSSKVFTVSDRVQLDSILRLLAETAAATNQPSLSQSVKSYNPSIPTTAVPSRPGSPPPESKSHLVLDQNVDDFDLEAALEGLKDHAVVQLGPITLRLRMPVTINKPLTLRGAGMDQTRIVCETSALAGILNFEGEGPWTLHDFTVERVQAEEMEEDVDRHCVVVDGKIDVRGCRFLGAPGTGLLCLDQSQGLVTQCQSQANSTGIVVADDAEINLKDNVCGNNGFAGIGYQGQASGLAQGNRCEDNHSHGISVSDEASPTLESNHCQKNKEVGIIYFDSADGSANGNQCCENGQFGIYVGGEASPTLELNHCLRNERVGIIYLEDSDGSANGNQCCENGEFGIWVSDQAAPTLEDNHCLRNKGAGIGYSESAEGSAKGNHCAENELSGIQVADDSLPNLEGNHCLRNGGAGICYSDSAGGDAKGNHCAENEVCGIWVSNQANPELESNVCKNNLLDGISVDDEAEPTLEFNQCEGNNHNGISFSGDSQGSARENHCTDNEYQGIEVIGQAGPQLTDNVARGNGLNSAWRNLGVMPADGVRFEQLVTTVAQYDGPRWMNAFFTLLHDVLKQFHLTGNDPRLSLSLKGGDLSVSVGQRYILTPIQGARGIKLILPLGIDATKYGGDSNPYYFTQNKVRMAQMNRVPLEPGQGLPEQLKRLWFQAVELEAHRSKSSSYRKHHDYLFYQAVMDDHFRKRLLWEAFGIPISTALVQ